MKINENLCTKNPCYKTGETIKVKGLMLHSVGVPQPSAAVFIKQWDKVKPATTVCPHAVIDGNTGDVHQTLPWNHRGWHGGGSSNDTHIGVEMCEPACIEYTGGANFTCSDRAQATAVVKRTYKSAVQLFAELCEQFDLDPLKDGVIVSHKEGFKRGISSNHADPEHLWNGLGLDYTMDTFRKAVKAAMGDITKKEPQQTAFKPYTVKVIYPALNIRKTPKWGDADIVGVIRDRGVYTITAETMVGTTKFGKLKSGAGWISLEPKYTKKL